MAEEKYVDLGVGMLGNVDSGKSTVIGALVTGKKDDGDGLLRKDVSRHPHEISSGRTSDIAYHPAVFGKNRITFCDLAGHEKYLKTTIQGLGSFLPDLICLCVDKYTPTYKMTREHLGITFRMKIPFIVIMTKIDLYDEDVTTHSLTQLSTLIKRNSSRKPYTIKRIQDVDLAVRTYLGMSIIPIFHVSNVTLQGYDTLKEFLSRISKPVNTRFFHPSCFMVDRDYRIRGIGLVVSGFNGTGVLNVGDKILINNTHDGIIRSIHNDFREVVQSLPHGVRGCLGIRSVVDRVPIGTVISLNPVLMVQEFIASVNILTSHSVTITKGYQTVIHCGCIRRPCTITNPTPVIFRGGDNGRLYFKMFKPAYLEVNQSIFFREGTVIGDGQIVELL